MMITNWMVFCLFFDCDVERRLPLNFKVVKSISLWHEKKKSTLTTIMSNTKSFISDSQTLEIENKGNVTPSKCTSLHPSVGVFRFALTQTTSSPSSSIIHTGSCAKCASVTVSVRCVSKFPTFRLSCKHIIALLTNYSTETLNTPCY